jgi:hypothetical protein
VQTVSEAESFTGDILDAEDMKVYSSIAQRNSYISLQVATTSTRLTEASQEVAIAASRDGAVMRVIAAIIMFFLPATFTAVSFYETKTVSCYLLTRTRLSSTSTQISMDESILHGCGCISWSLSFLLRQL